MSRYHRRRRPTVRESLTAAALATGIGAATFYLVRTFLARDPLEEPARTRSGGPPGEEPSDRRSTSPSPDPPAVPPEAG